MHRIDQADLGPGTRIRSLGPVGIEVSGFDLKRATSESESGAEAFPALREHVVAEGLVIFRDQTLLPAAHIALGQRFGTLESLRVEGDEASGTKEPAALGMDDPALIVIGNLDSEGETFADEDPRMKLMAINEGWHTDSSFRECPASFSIFAAVTLPPVGGDTFFASLHRGWEALAPEEQEKLYGRMGVHDYDAAYRLRGNTSGNVVGFNMPAVEHPLVRAHPETGRSGLYVSEHVAGVAGMNSSEALPVLDHLIEVTTHPRRVYRHRWMPGDVAIWDNRSMLHRAQGFDSRHPRVMHHVRVAGSELPIAAVPPSSE